MSLPAPVLIESRSAAVAAAHRLAFLRKHAARNFDDRADGSFERGARLTLLADQIERAIVEWALTS